MKRTLKHPAKAEEWRESFRKNSMRVGFQISLSKAMLEMLCAIADDVMWDRSLFWSQHFPDNWIASQNSLIKRGLIERKTDAEFKKQYPNWGIKDDTPRGEWTCYKLTPAGRGVVTLVTLAGMFIESDAAISKKARKA